MSYESPIKMYIDKVTNNIIQEEEDHIISEIHKLGIVIDKEELMRALQYDRSQYELGFHDGSKNSIPIEWIYKWIENIPNNWRGYSEDWNYNIDGEVKKVIYKNNTTILLPCITDMLDDWRSNNE